MSNDTTDPERVMIDIETLGLEPGAAILSIGAVKFDTDGLGDELYHEISLESCQDAGLQIDAGTLEWWLDQDDSVTGILTGGADLRDALGDLWSFCEDVDEVWANSPSFDCEMLETAVHAVGMTEPWEYHQERDVRTLRSLPGVPELEMVGDEHDALDDAKHQARIASEGLRFLGERAEMAGVSD